LSDGKDFQSGAIMAISAAQGIDHEECDIQADCSECRWWSKRKTNRGRGLLEYSQSEIS